MKRTQLFLTKSDVQAILLAINDCTGDVASHAECCA